MSLKSYFIKLVQKVEASDAITNAGKDSNGFYSPTRTLVLRHLNLLKDLHAKPMAKPMLRDSWKFITEHVPVEWLVLSDDEKKSLQQMLE